MTEVIYTGFGRNSEAFFFVLKPDMEREGIEPRVQIVKQSKTVGDVGVTKLEAPNREYSLKIEVNFWSSRDGKTTGCCDPAQMKIFEIERGQ